MSEFKMNLDSNAKNLMELFGVSQERCEELCGLVDNIEKENPEWGIHQVLDEASKHSANENENRFLIATYFKDHGIQAGYKLSKVDEVIGSLFERATKHSTFERHHYN